MALATATFGGLALGSAVVARHRAQSAADLAALAAAAQLAAGVDTACRAATGVAAANRTTVRGCHVESLDVVVTVSAAVGSWAGADARASARAGPADGG